MTIIDTFHCGGVDWMHGGLTMSSGHEAKSVLFPCMVAETNCLDRSRPGLVIRGRLMGRQPKEAGTAAAGPFTGLTPALLNQPNAANPQRVNHSHRMMMDHSSKQCDVRSSFPTTNITAQDQCPPMTKSPKKTLRLFDLNNLPSVQENAWSPCSSPTSTIESADSITHLHASATRPAGVLCSPGSPNAKRFRDEGGALEVDLGLLPPMASRHSSEAEGLRLDQAFAVREPQPQEAENADHVPTTPARKKRLRKLSDWAGGHSSSDSIAKSWTTRNGPLEDVTKTKTLVSASPDAKVRGADVVDDKVFGAVAALLLLSSSSKNHIRRRDFPFSSNAGASSSAHSAFAGSQKEEREAGTGSSDPGSSSDLAASDNEEPSRSSGSGGSVLLRPKNKQHYRSMAEIMAQVSTRSRRRV